MFTKKDSRNLEQKYCYCGEHKPNEPTVMCAECNHWFHISCCDQRIMGPYRDEENQQL